MADNQTLEALSELQVGRLFADLPAVLDRWHWVVVAGSVLVLGFGHLWRMHEARNQGRAVSEQWYLTLLALLFVVTSPVLASRVVEASQSWEASEEPQGAMAVARRFVNLAITFPDMESVLEPVPDSEDLRATEAEYQRDAGLLGYAGALLNDDREDAALLPSDVGAPQPWSLSLARESATEVVTSMKGWSILATYVITTSCLLGSAAAVWMGEVVRFIGLALGAFGLPFAIACFRVHALREVGARWITTGVALLAWPVLWRVGHMATQRFFDAYLRLFAAGSSAGEEAGSLSWASIDQSASGESLAHGWAGLIHETGAAVPFGWLVLVSVAAGLLLLWVCLVIAGSGWVCLKLFRIVSNRVILTEEGRAVIFTDKLSTKSEYLYSAVREASLKAPSHDPLLQRPSSGGAALGAPSERAPSVPS